MRYFLKSKHPQARVDLEQLFNDTEFLVIDAETTGLNKKKDKLISLACIRITKGQIQVNTLQNWIIQQDQPHWNEAIKIHGILPSETAKGDSERTVLEALLSELTDRIIIGHHIGFDLAIINRALQQNFGRSLINPSIDTAQLAMQELSAFLPTGYANQHPPSLDELCTHLGLKATERHTAAGDAFTTAEVFLILCARMRQRQSIPLKLGNFPFRK